MADVLDDFFPVTTQAAEETVALGRAVAAHLQPGDVLALSGNLGAGKTHFTKGVCAALGVPLERVNSPTFTIVNEYIGRDFPIYHLDAYRIKHPEELAEMGLEEYLYAGGLCLIEWPRQAAAFLPEHTRVLRFTHGTGDERRVELLTVPA